MLASSEHFLCELNNYIMLLILTMVMTLYCPRTHNRETRLDLASHFTSILITINPIKAIISSTNSIDFICPLIQEQYFCR